MPAQYIYIVPSIPYPLTDVTPTPQCSPADKADLEVGDEILEVNGRSLEDATHTEVIQHIHQVAALDHQA
ncbi:hypothetical protein HAZT_HAZT008529 [Hyalella azteca]|uniref:PDZ domain-containing protein n=1 Tax=Hyalella azteca TaxID=294128 RepID=A0A6A0HB28_HYAAZ|nr:hypothetical protein HAZT_HAZT008529 [Hyalella azteca]